MSRLLTPKTIRRASSALRHPLCALTQWEKASSAGAAAMSSGLWQHDSLRQLSPSQGRGLSSVAHGPGSKYWAEVLRQVSEGTPDSGGERVAITNFEVLEIGLDGSPVQASHSPSSLGLHSRHISVFTSKRTHASISPRGSSIHFINDFCRAIISSEKVVIFPCWRIRHTVAVAEAVASRVRSHRDRNPFELNVLEALLNSSVKHFYIRARQLDMLVNIITSNTRALASPDFQTMLPLQQTVSETYQDVKEFQEAVSEVLKDDKAVSARSFHLLHQTRQEPSELSQEELLHTCHAEEVLSSYQLQIQAIEGMFEEMQEQLSIARDVTRMQMSSKRNYYVQTNLVISIANLALLSCTITSGFFGMNLVSGWETSAGLFPLVVGGSLAASSLIFSGIYHFVARQPQRDAQASIKQLATIRSLVVNHIDDIGDIVNYAMNRASDDGTKRLQRGQFHMIAWEATKSRRKPMSQEEVDLLFDFFDQDNTNVLEAHEMEAMYNKLVEHPESIRLNGGRGWAAKSYWRSSRAEEAADRMSFDSH